MEPLANLISPGDLVSLIVGAAGPRKVWLGLDYDGTLVPIRRSPGEVVTPPEVLALLAELVRKPWLTVAVVSGRRIEELAERLPVTGLYLAGHHGGVIIGPRGTEFTYVLRPEEEKQLDYLVRYLELRVAGLPGVWVERKRFSVALHYRQASGRHAARALRVMNEVARTELPKGLQLLRGRKLVEVRPRDLNKGKAVEYFLAGRERLFPVFIGDDVTDEDAFRALGREGLGVLVSAVPRPTLAGYRLEGPGRVRDLLYRLTRVNQEGDGDEGIQSNNSSGRLGNAISSRHQGPAQGNASHSR